LYTAAAGIVVPGLVLLGVGRRAPGGVAATWAVIWSVPILMSLVLLLARSIRSIDPDALHRRRLERVRRQTAAEVERIVLERIAAALLTQICNQEGVVLQGFAPAPAHTTAVVAHDAGRVADVRLRRL